MVQQTTTRIDGEPARVADSLVEVIGNTLLSMGAAATPEQAQRRAAITLAEALPALTAALDAQAPAAKKELAACLGGAQAEVGKRATEARRVEGAANGAGVSTRVDSPAPSSAPASAARSPLEEEEEAARLVAFGQLCMQEFALASLDTITEQAATWEAIGRTLSTLQSGVPTSSLSRADLFSKLHRDIAHMISVREMTAVHATARALAGVATSTETVLYSARAAATDPSPF